MEKNRFWVVTTIFNPVNYNSRKELYFNFAKHMEQCGVNLFVVELAFGEKPFEVTEEGNPNHLQLRTKDIIWHKERLINLGVQRLPRNWEYVAWIDADILFVNPNWVSDTLLKLQYHPVVQLFSNAIDLDASSSVLKVHESFAYAYHHGLAMTKKPYENYSKWFHPGFAWAMRRDAFDKMCGLIDYAALGSADNHMAHGFIGKMANTFVKGYSDGYILRLKEWQKDCDRFIKGNLGYVSGAITHFWHGTKKDRGYTTRYNTLIKHKYDPNIHLETDWQGVYRWNQNACHLEYDIYKYFLSRNEDGREEKIPS